jgi:alpha-glucoside transport system substrate-binding protein
MRKFRFVAPIITGVLVLAACTPAGNEGSPGGSGGGGELAQGDGTIEVTSLWGGAEADAFQAMLDDFMASHEGIEVTYTSVRQDYASVLSNRIDQQDPPDIAIIPGIGFVRSFARDDLLIPLEDLGIDRASIEDNYAPGILDVGTVNDQLVALMVKYNSKGTVWYKPPTFEDNGYDVPTSWDDLLALTDQMKSDGLGAPWAVGAADSWNLTDIFEMIYLTTAGEDAYDTLFGPDGNWTDQTVLDAAAAMTDLYTDDNIVGGISGALATAFVDAIGQIYSANGDAQLFYEGGFVAGIATGDVNPDLTAPDDIDFFDFPPGGKTTIGGDVIAAFVADTDVAAFMEYMTTPESGAAWAAGGTIISPIKSVDSSVYESVGPLAVKEAEQVANADAVRFDGSDLLPAGTDLGAVLQAILQDPGSAQSQFETFQSQVDQAWADEQGG